MSVRGLRGATIAQANTAEAIRCATRELMLALVAANPQLHPDDMASIIFTCTPDLTAEPPARAVRDLGWGQVALMCVTEMDTPAGLRYCIRVLIHWNTDKKAADIRHVYLHSAAQLRPDRAATRAST